MLLWSYRRMPSKISSYMQIFHHNVLLYLFNLHQNGQWGHEYFKTEPTFTASLPFVQIKLQKRIPAEIKESATYRDNIQLQRRA